MIHMYRSYYPYPQIAQISQSWIYNGSIMADAGKAALYLWWVLEELGIIMNKPPHTILADNQVRYKSISECTSTNTENETHVEMKHFIIL